MTPVQNLNSSNMTSVGKSELLTWLANSAGYASISDWGVMTDGVAVMRCIKKFWPITCRGIITGGFNWTITEEEEKRRNWRVIEQCLKAVTVPIEIFEFGKIAQGKKKACYHFLVMMYFIGAIHSGTAKNIAFAYPIEAPLKEFLQSERVVKVAQMDAQKRRQQRKPKCYSTTPSNLTMIDADECDDIFEPLNFSTKDLVNIFADADLCTSPSTKTPNRHHPSGLVHLQLAGEKVKNVLSQNIATVAKTTRDGEEYSAMSPYKSVSSSISKPPISPEEHPDTAKCFKTRESSATSLHSRESVTTSEGSTRKHRSSQDESFRSCPQFITPSHSISEDHEDVAKEEPHAVRPSPRKPSPSDSFAAIKAAATAAVLNASRGPMESSTSSVIHQLPEQVSVPSVQNHAIRRLIAGSKPSVSGSPRPVSEKTPLSRNDGSLCQASARSRPSTFRTSTVTHSGCSTGACPSYSPSVSRYIRLNSPSAGLSRFHDNGAHYQESGLKINYLYDSKKEATSSISSICSSMNNSSAATLSLLQTDEKAQAYVEKVGTMLQQLNSKAANTIEVKTATSSKPPHMAGLALLSFSNSDTSDGVSDLQIGPDAYAADSSKEATTATAPQRTSSANSNLRSSMLSHTPSRSSTTACFSCTSSEEVSTEIDPKTSSIKSPDEQKSLADYEKGPSVPKNLPRWPSKKVTKGISPIAPTGLSISTTSSSNQTHGPDITNSLLNDTKLTLTSSNTVNASNVVSMYSSDCPTSILSSGVQGSGISLVTSSNGSMAPTNTSMPDMEKATQSVKYLGPFSEKPAEATLVHDLSSKPSMVNLLHSQFGAFPVAVDSSTSIPMVVSSFNSNYSQPPPPPAPDPKSLITNLKKAYQEASLPNVLPSANQHTLSSSRTNGNLADCGSSIIEHTQNLQSSTSFPDNISLSLNVGDASRYSGAHLIGSTKQCLPSSTSDTFLFASSTSGFGLAGGTHSLFTDLQEVREGTANILKLTNNMDEQHASSQSTPHSINTSLYTSESNHNIASTESLDKHKVTSGRPQPSIPILLTSGSVVDRPSFIPRFQAPPPASVGQSQSSLDLEQAADIALIKSVCNKFNDMEELSRQKDAQIDSYGDLLANLEEMFRISKEEATRIQEIYDKKIKFLDEFSTKKAFIIAHALHTEFLKNKFSPNGLENRKGLEDFQGMLLSHQNTVAKYIDELKAFEASLRDDLFSLSKFEERYNDLTNNKYIAALKAINTELALKLGQVTEELAQLTSLSMNNALSNVSPIADMHRSGPEVDSPDLCFATGRAPTAATEATSGHLRNPANLSLSSPQTTQILRPGNLTIDTFVKTLVMNSQLLMKMEDTVSELDRYKAHSGLIDPINMELATLALASSDAIANADPERALKNYEDNILHIIQLLKSNANHYLSQDATAIIIKHLGLENAVLPSAVKSMIDQHRSLLLELTRDGSINATYPAASQVANIAATLFDENSIATILKENNIDNTERNRFLYLRSVAAQLLCSENVLSHRLNASQLYLQNIAQFMQKYAPAVAGGILADADSRERIVSMVSADIDRLRNDYGSKLLETQAAVAQLVRENESLKAELLHYKQIVGSALTNAAPVVSTVQQLKHRDALFFELLGLYEKLLRESNGEEEQLRSYLNDIAFFKAQLQRSAINYEQFAHDCTNCVITDTIHNYLHAVQLELDNRTEQLAVIKNNLVTERSNTDLICEHSRVLEDRIARLEAENYSLRLLSKESSMHADLSSLMASTPLLSY